MKHIGEVISSKRKSLGMTQKELAEKLNVTDKAISKWETGATLPDVEMLGRIAEVFSCNVEVFFLNNNSDKKNNVESTSINTHNNSRKKNKRLIILASIFSSIVIIFGIAFGVKEYSKAKNNKLTSSNSTTTNTNTSTSTSFDEEDIEIYKAMKILLVVGYYPEGKTDANYSDSNKTMIATYRLSATADIYLANSITSVDNIYSSFVSKINNLPTI